MIAQWQIDQFHQQGFLVVEEVLSSADIAALQSDFDGWVWNFCPVCGFIMEDATEEKKDG